MSQGLDSTATVSPKSPVPGHVPPNLVVDFDAMNPLLGDERYHDAYARMSGPEVPDIFWSPYNGGHWVVRRDNILAEAFAAFENFTSANGMTVPRSADTRPKLPPVETDPPMQGVYRKLFSSAFTVPALKAREDSVRALAVSLIEGFQARGRCEFVREFAQHLPMRVFLGMVDLPDDDRLYLISLADSQVSSGTTKSKEEMLGKLMGYVGQKLAERAKNPGDDLLSKIATAEIEGRPITPFEAMSVGSLLLIGGLDTVASMMGHIMHFLAGSETHRRQLLQSPIIIRDAAEEFLRRFSLTNPARSAVRDLEFHGVHVKQGDMILLATPFGAVDPSKYDNPLAIDFARKSTTKTVFGAGPHVCPGSMLARMELRVLLEEWLPRIPDFAIDPDDRPRIRTGINGSFEHLPLVWTPK